MDAIAIGSEVIPSEERDESAIKESAEVVLAKDCLKEGSPKEPVRCVSMDPDAYGSMNSLSNEAAPEKATECANLASPTAMHDGFEEALAHHLKALQTALLEEHRLARGSTKCSRQVGRVVSGASRGMHRHKECSISSGGRNISDCSLGSDAFPALHASALRTNGTPQSPVIAPRDLMMTREASYQSSHVSFSMQPGPMMQPEMSRVNSGQDDGNGDHHRRRPAASLRSLDTGTDSVRDTLARILDRADDETQKGKGLLGALVTRPMNPFRLVWDAVGAVTILYEIILFPMQVFELPESLRSAFLLYFVATFWLVDMCSQFLAGYTDHGGSLEMRPAKTAKRYLKTWFCFDLTIVSADWMFIIASASGELLRTLRVGKLMKIFQLVRAVRLARIGKYQAVFNKIHEVVEAEWVLLVVKLSKLSMLLLMINHYICCVWYWLGTRSDESRSWIQELEGTNTGWRYLTSLQWSLSQFTPSGSEVVPRNTAERTFSVCIVLFGMACSSSFVSSITTAIQQLRQYNQEQSQEEHNLRTFMGCHKLSSNLVSRIWAFVRQSSGRKVGRIVESKVALMRELPASMLMEIHLEVYAPFITKHPLLHLIAHKNLTVLNNICHSAMSYRTVVVNHELFLQGSRCSRMVFVVAGEFTYFKNMLLGRFDCKKNKNDEVGDSTVKSGEWVCENCLWIDEWYHIGNLVASRTSEVYEMSAEGFRDACNNMPEVDVYKATWVRHQKTEQTELCCDHIIKAAVNAANKQCGSSEPDDKKKKQMRQFLNR